MASMRIDIIGFILRIEKILNRNTEVIDAKISARMRSERIDSPNIENEKALNNALSGV